MEIIGFGILLAGILIIRKAAWKHISRVAQYSLWIFAALFLLLSPFVEIPAKVIPNNFRHSLLEENIMNGYDVQGEVEDTDVSAVGYQEVSDAQGNMARLYLPQVGATAVLQNPSPSEQESGNGSRMTEEAGDGQSFERLREISPGTVLKYLPYIRWSGTLMFLFTVLLRNICFDAYCGKNRVFYRDMEEMNMRVYLLDGMSSPFLFRGNIYVDTTVTEDESMLQHIILHEYCHHRHRDNFWAFVRILCLALNWYNPFVWIANDFVKRDCELACDESVLLLLNEEERTQYGYTLLKMVKPTHSKFLSSPMATTMSNRGKKVKERILMIKYSGKNHKSAAWMAAFFVLLLTGCAFAGGNLSGEAEVLAENQTEDNERIEALAENQTVEPEAANEPTENPTGESEVADNGEINRAAVDKPDLSDNEYKYYNVSVKGNDDGYMYVASNGLYRVSKEDREPEVVFPEPVILGTIGEGYLFFYTYRENAAESGIVALNLSGGLGVGNTFLGGDIYSYHEMCVKDGKLYVAHTRDGSGETLIFDIQEGGSLVENGTLQVKVPDELASGDERFVQLSDVISMSEGYTGNFFVSQSEGARYYDTLYYCEDGNIVNVIEGITDVMITSGGIIGRDTASYNDIYVWDAYTGDKKLLYSADSQGGVYCGYNNYSEKGVYGLLHESEDSNTIVRIGWDGSLKKLYTIKSTEVLYGIHAQISVIDDWIYYYNPVNEAIAWIADD